MKIFVCEKCGKKKGFISELTGEIIPCLCDCDKKRVEEQERESARRQRLLQVSELKGASLLGERFSTASFADTRIGENESFDSAFARCKRYCENADKVYENGYGIYLHGDKGTGKTHLAACIVNDLSERLVPAVFTNFGVIAKIALNAPEQFERLCKVEFLVIDDIGAQRVRGKDGDLWLQEKVYEVVNCRYNEMLPTIFTSNYPLGDLMAKCGVWARTVDRMVEMSSAVMKITGTSKRAEKALQQLPF